MKKEDSIHILTAMKKSYLSLGIPDPEAVEALEMAIKAIQTDNSEKVYQKAFEDIRTELIRWIEMDGGSDEYDKALKRGLIIVDKHDPAKMKSEASE